jgi:integrase
MINPTFETLVMRKLAALDEKLQGLIDRQEASGTEATAEENLELVAEVSPERSSLTSEPRISQAIHLYLKHKRDYVTPQHHENLTRQLAAMVPEPYYWTPGQVTRGDLIHRTDMLRAEGRSEKTINNHLSAFSSFLTWCLSRGHVDEDVSQGLKKKATTRASRRRKAFTDEEIKWIFSELESKLTGAPDVAKYWLPLIMLYSGARPEEIAQLRVCDVRRVHSSDHGPSTPPAAAYWVFDFTGRGDEQRIKNDASRRIVPIHPELLSKGLLKIIEYRKKESENLLFDQLRHGASGRLAEAPSRWFNEVWLRDVKAIADPKKVLYSLRHTVATKLKHATVPEAMISEILGHANSSMSTGRYGKEYPLSEMQRAMEALNWVL